MGGLFRVTKQPPQFGSEIERARNEKSPEEEKKKKKKLTFTVLGG